MFDWRLVVRMLGLGHINKPHRRKRPVALTTQFNIQVCQDFSEFGVCLGKWITLPLAILNTQDNVFARIPGKQYG